MTSFTDLPAETRNIIYNELLTDATADPKCLNNNLALLTASRLMHEEAASYFYQHSAFTVSLSAAMYVRRRSAIPEPSQGSSILPQIPDKYLKYLRRLTIDVCLNTSKTSECALRISALANVGATFSTLTLNFCSDTSRILAREVDDCVLHAEHPITLALWHLLSFKVAQSVQINLDNVWFAPGIAVHLQSEFEGRLEVLTSAASPTRALTGQTTHSHLYNLTLSSQDCEDAEYLQPLYSPSISPPSMPLTLSSALSEMDQFSLPDFLEEDSEDLQSPAKVGRAASLLDEPMFEMDDVEDGGEELLTEDDDVEDEELEDVDDIEAIIGNLEEAAHRRANEMDVCYMTNFAPDLLGRWLEEAAW